MKNTPRRHLRFTSVSNFRDIGGYPTRQGQTVAWRRVFRSGEFNKITPEDLDRLLTELKLSTIVDLRSGYEVERQGLGLLSSANLKYHNVVFMSDGGDPKVDEQRYKNMSNMGQFYLDMAGKKSYGAKMVEALEIIADSHNYPLVFNCAVGKDRTGMLAASLLSLLDVPDDVIIEDYTLSEPYMDEILARLRKSPRDVESIKTLPAYFWKASPDSMRLFLTALKQEYGSVRGYLETCGASKSLAGRLADALLE